MRLIGDALLNFLKCLVYIFVPLGGVLLGALLGVNVLINAIPQNVSALVHDVGEILPEVKAQANELLAYLITAIRSLDWSDVGMAIRTMLSPQWLSALFAEFFRLSEAAAAELTTQLSVAISMFIFNVIRTLIVAGVAVGVGILLGYFVTGAFVRSRTIRRGWKKSLLNSLVDTVLSSTLISFVVWFMALLNPGAVASTIVTVLLYGFVGLIEAYCLFGQGKLPFFAVVNLKNCLLLLVAEVLIYVTTIYLIVFVAILAGKLVALAVGLSIALIALFVINLNAEYYVVMLVKKWETSARLRIPKWRKLSPKRYDNGGWL